MIKKLNVLYMPVLCRSLIFSISDFIFYTCFIMWSVIIVLPYNYIVNKVKLMLINVHEEGGAEQVRYFLYTVATCICLIMGVIVRKIYDCFFDDWYTYIILLIVVYLFGKKSGNIILYKLHDFWRDVNAENITDMARRRYDQARDTQYHTVVYDIDSMF